MINNNNQEGKKQNKEAVVGGDGDVSCVLSYTMSIQTETNTLRKRKETCQQFVHFNYANAFIQERLNSTH